MKSLVLAEVGDLIDVDGALPDSLDRPRNADRAGAPEQLIRRTRTEIVLASHRGAHHTIQRAGGAGSAAA
jgi:hypothetical protein